MTSLKRFSPIVADFIKFFWFFSAASICDERKTSVSFCSNRFCRLLMMRQEFIIFNPCIAQIFRNIFCRCKSDTFFELCHKPSNAMTWQNSRLNSIRCTHSNFLSGSHFLFVDRLLYDLVKWKFYEIAFDRLTETWPFINSRKIVRWVRCSCCWVVQFYEK